MKFKSFCKLALVGIVGGIVSSPTVMADGPVVSLPAVENATPASAPAPVLTPAPAPAPVADTVQAMLADSCNKLAKGDVDGALAEATQIITANPRNKNAFMLRATIYARQKEWDKAEYDYNVAQTIDPVDSAVKFNEAELKFMQKKYDEARIGFVDLQKDKDLGDFATYKVFLCDLFGAHEDVAAKELDALNEVGGNPSYYFGNAAWDLVHNKTDDATNWLKSAARIYSGAPEKIAHYTASLESLGYLPLHPASS